MKHTQSGGGGDLVTAGQYEDFELEFEWKLGRGANSGVKYLVTEDQSQAIGIEYQLLDESRSTNAPPAKVGKYSTAAAYDLLAPTDIPVRPVGEFNQSRVVLQGNRVEHWLNDVKVLQFELNAPAFLSAIEQSKFKAVNGFAKKRPAHILLQDHGGEVWFRNLRIRELPPAAK